MKRTNRGIVLATLAREFSSLRQAENSKEVARLAFLRRKADEASRQIRARRVVEFRAFALRARGFGV